MKKLRFVRYSRWGLTIDIGHSWVFDCFRVMIKIGKWGFTYRDRSNG